MIDFHNHVLPNIDDGSKSMEESLMMLQCAINQGITDVVSTVHYQHPKFNDEKFNYLKINKTLETLQDNIGSKIKIHLGAEVFFLPNLINIKSEKITVFNHGKYMLIEFYPFHIPPNYKEEFYKLKLSGTTPIIAHPERNKIIQNNINIAEDLIESGCLLQLDAGSILGYFGKNCYDISKKMLCRNMIHFIGSDAHNSNKRNFCLYPAFKKTKDLIGKKSNRLVENNPHKLINGEKIEPFEILNDTIKSNFFFRNLEKFFKN